MGTRVFHHGELDVGATVTLDSRAVAHVQRVLRLGAGDPLTLFNGDGNDYAAEILASPRGSVELRIESRSSVATESPLAITLMQGLSRSQRMDWAIQKATELGVSEIRPVICTRSVVRLDDKRRSAKLAHWRGVAASACEQSGRARIPHIEPPASLGDALGQTGSPGQARILLDAHGDDALASLLDGADSAVLLVGPEGGLTQDEKRNAADSGFRRVRLGPRVLRTETAPVAALTLIQYLAGDFRPSR